MRTLFGATLLSVGATVIWVGGCRFDTDTSVLGNEDGGSSPLVDAAEAAMDSGIIDATLPDAVPCSFGDQDICDTGESDGPLTIDADTTINTDTDPLCRSFAQTDGPELCLIVVDSFALNSGARLAGVGSRPLMIASIGDINISGSLDVSSAIGGQVGAGANDSACATTSAPEDDQGGAGGGAGGSFAGAGGNGGAGDTDESAGNNGDGAGGIASGSVSLPAVLRGGCPGDTGAIRTGFVGGAGGSSGGAVLLHTPAGINLNGGGNIQANGAGGAGGGAHCGGGGGGSGGHVILQAASINFGGNISANGGGGGEGGVLFDNNSTIDGNDGEDGALSFSEAFGGFGASSFGGNGGDGSNVNDLDGLNGAGRAGGGGGGGGAAGFIVFRGTLNDNGGNTSPPATET